jgi:hypothetical protein
MDARQCTSDVNQPSAAMTRTSSSRPGPITITIAELRCLQCGRSPGEVLTQRVEISGPVAFRRHGCGVLVRVDDWRRLRCDTCGGNTYVDEVETNRIYPRETWDDEQPRRGRPPRWLVEQRRLARRMDGLADA